MNREQRERREQGIITDTPFFGGKGELSLRGKFSGLQGVLRLKIMNREQREGYEQGEIDQTNFCGFRVFRG